MTATEFARRVRQERELELAQDRGHETKQKREDEAEAAIPTTADGEAIAVRSSIALVDDFECCRCFFLQILFFLASIELLSGSFRLDTFLCCLFCLLFTVSRFR